MICEHGLDRPHKSYPMDSDEVIECAGPPTWIDYDDGHAGGFPHAHTDAAAELREALVRIDGLYPTPEQFQVIEDAARTIALPILEETRSEPNEAARLGIGVDIARLIHESAEESASRIRSLRSDEDPARRRERLRKEYIQIAAVAVEAVQVLDMGTTGSMSHMRAVLAQVQDERYEQEKKWGPQQHNQQTWLAILAEEVGEAAREVDREPPLTVWDNMRWALITAESDARAYLKGL